MTTTETTRTRVSEVMTRDPICVKRSDTVREVARLFDANEISGSPVVDAQDRLIGVVSKTDILHRILEGREGSQPQSMFERMAEGLAAGTDLDPEELGAVEEFMTPDPITAHPDQPVWDVAHRMAREGVHRIIIVDSGNHPVGIVTALDALGVFPK